MAVRRSSRLCSRSIVRGYYWHWQNGNRNHGIEYTFIFFFFFIEKNKKHGKQCRFACLHISFTWMSWFSLLSFCNGRPLYLSPCPSFVMVTCAVSIGPLALGPIETAGWNPHQRIFFEQHPHGHIRYLIYNCKWLSCSRPNSVFHISKLKEYIKKKKILSMWIGSPRDRKKKKKKRLFNKFA